MLKSKKKERKNLINNLSNYVGYEWHLRSFCLLSCVGKVFVHCARGISRSATLVLAFLMIKERQTLVEALEVVRKHRNILPNVGFLNQLCILDSSLALQRRAMWDETSRERFLLVLICKIIIKIENICSIKTSHILFTSQTCVFSFWMYCSTNLFPFISVNYEHELANSANYLHNQCHHKV